MQSCRVSVCEFRPSETAHECTRPKQTKYSAFMKHLHSHKRSSLSSCDSQTLPNPTSSASPLHLEGALLMTPTGNRDELFVLLKGKNYFARFQKPSKNTQTEPSRPYPYDHSSLPQHLANRKREKLRKKKLAETIQRDKIQRHCSQRKFLKRTLTVQLGLAFKNYNFL